MPIGMQGSKAIARVCWHRSNARALSRWPRIWSRPIRGRGINRCITLCRNLDGAFSVTQLYQGQPVLLVDDIVDSGWTLTVVAALLQQAGSGVVYPVALASSSVKDS